MPGEYLAPPTDSEIAATVGHWHDGPAPESERTDEMAGYRALACAIFVEVIRDASRQPGRWLDYRRTADYAFWCEVAGMDPERLHHAVMRRLCQGDATLRRAHSGHQRSAVRVVTAEGRAKMGEASARRHAARRAQKEAARG